jgi:hypothetical protein
LCRYGKSQNLIARQHFLMVLLWGQLHRDFLRFANWTRASGWRGNFYQVAQGQHSLLCALSTTESLSCPKSIGSIGGNPIFGVNNIQVVQKQEAARQYSCWEDSLGICWSSVGWHRRRDVQLISQEIDAVSRLFCAHSPDLLKSYL